MTDVRVSSPIRLENKWFPGILAPYSALILGHGLLSVVFAYSTGFAFDPGMAGLLAMVLSYLLPWFLMALLIRRVALLAIVDRSKSPVTDLKTSLMTLARDRERLLAGAVKFALIAFFVGSFGYQKELVAVFQDFGWDTTFAELDRFLHFGQDPYRLLLPFTGSPIATTALNAAYHAWFFVIYFVVFVACFAPVRHGPSGSFLLGLVLTFAVGGNLMAIAFSSAGPVYFERLGLGADFAPLMAHLNEVAEISPVWALNVQEGLWEGYTDDGVLAGISAMPSMHVATSVLMAFYAWTYARWAGWVMTVFAVTIQIGSVHLGWHYAVDGYIGALIAWGAWHAGQYIANRPS